MGMESFRCVVCQEEITPQEHSYSTNLFNMALCRKHQDIQKQIRAKTEADQKTKSIPTESKTTVGIQNSCCVVCQEEITPQEHSYSTNLFNMALCRKHQEIQKQIRAKTEADQKTYSITIESKTTSNVKSKEATTPVQKATIPEKVDDTLIQGLIQWVASKPINLAVESKQFFLEGLRLEELARDLIEKAKDEILVTSPYVDSCHPITLLTEAKDRRVNVRIVTTRPTKDKNDVKKVECHALLRKKGVNIHYINTIHAKIIIIDRKVAIVSSMNLYSGSTGGGLLEAGIVSFESKVVESASKYINDLLAKTESPDITSYSSSNWRR
jgi:phosphatidylserine/phosphatidylglycerophosphate/cardiolipin synthase-like enzyme